MQKLSNLAFVLAFVFLFWGCDTSSKKNKELSSFIPESTQTVLKVKNWGITAQDFKKNNLLNQLKGEPFSEFFNTKKSVFDLVKPTGNVILCKEAVNDSTNHFTLITKISSNLFKLDSIEGVSQTDIPFNGKNIKKTVFNASEAFSIQIDSVFIISTSEAILKKSVEGKVKKETLFSKAYKLKNDQQLAYIHELNSIKENDSISFPFASLASFDLQVLPDGVVGNGVVLVNDSLPQLLSVFKGQIPQKNDAASIIPISAKEARSFTFNDVKLLEKNIQLFKSDSVHIDPLFESINEIVTLKFSNENAIALKSLDTQITWDELAKYISEKETYREVQLFSFMEEQPLFKVLMPLVEDTTFSIVFEWEDFIIFTETEETAQQLISDFQNNVVLANAPYFESAYAQLAQASSLTNYTLQGNTGALFSNILDAKTSKLNNFPLAIVQLIYDRDFAHLNLICKETSGKKQDSGLINQLISVPLDREIVGKPQFFTNHNTLGKDIVVQDISNVLYFISSNGKTLWKKQLDGAILGSINEVDILRNGKKQLAFSTKKTWYVLDRNGKDVAPFPKKCKDPITQPVSIFDYDNNRKYRFVICQDKDVFMYDGQGKDVSGFTFNKASSSIVLSPQHIRIGNKDYILIAEENGKLNILSRVGKERIKLNKTFDFSEIPIEKEGSNFVVITKNKSKETISQDGKVSSQALQVSKNYQFAIEGTTKVTLDDHLLRINGQLVELPLGVYSKPQIFSFNKESFIALTELKEHKVYLFNKSGKLFPNFPVYGTSEIDMADANKNKKINLIVKGQPKEVLLYQLN